jgi:superfamily I DNA and/or RNA helicase
MMPKVKHNALGWVLIDEAGQVPAQQATGILMRARRAMIIGDPLQLEPIVTLSPSIVACIRDVFGAHDRFVSHEDNAESLQTIADRASKYCSFRSAGQSDAQAVTQRIGIPLLVHRRCMKPMFSISNAIYGNQMVYAVNEMAPWDDCLPGVPSAWIDERSDARRHSVPQQVELVEKLVVRMSENFLIINEGQPLQPSIYVITPFREIEEKLKEAFSKYPDLSKWAKRGIGTIHKFQGKEADIVIVVLGLSAGNEFALQFAVAKPNMMNVAVTRAKRRLYVIGNAELWGDQKYFGDVYETMLAQGAVYDAASFTATVIDPIPVLRVLPKPKKPKASRKKAVR